MYSDFFPQAGTGCLYYYSGQLYAHCLFSLPPFYVVLLFLLARWCSTTASPVLLVVVVVVEAELSAKDVADDFLRFVSRAETAEI